MNTTITVRIGRDTIDPEGTGTDEECAAYESNVLDAVREAFPGADVRAVGQGGRTSGVDAEGHDITAAVREVVREASDAQA
jgi:hypothetical protein